MSRINMSSLIAYGASGPVTLCLAKESPERRFGFFGAVRSVFRRSRRLET